MRNNHEAPIVRDVITTKLPLVGPGNTAFEVIRTILKEKAPAALVVEEGRGVIGVFTEKSALKVLATTAYDRQIGGVAADYMDEVPETLTPETDLFIVAQRFLNTDVTALPVIEDGRLIGAVTRHDMVVAIEALEGLVVDNEATWNAYVKTVTDPESKEEMQPYLANATPEQRAESFRNRKTLQARPEPERDLPK